MASNIKNVYAQGTLTFSPLTRGPLLSPVGPALQFVAGAGLCGG